MIEYEFKVGDIIKLSNKHPLYSKHKKCLGIIININLDKNDMINFELIKVLVNGRCVNAEFDQIYKPKKYLNINYTII